MIIEFINSTPGIGFSWVAGQVVTSGTEALSDDLAKQFVADGYAIEVIQEADALHDTEQEHAPVDIKRSKKSSKGHS
jgi:hypothetical protein